MILHGGTQLDCVREVKQSAVYLKNAGESPADMTWDRLWASIKVSSTTKSAASLLKFRLGKGGRERRLGDWEWWKVNLWKNMEKKNKCFHTLAPLLQGIQGSAFAEAC